jgi:hypothetical protein
MRRFALTLLLLLPLMAAGCSDLQARGTMATTIDTQAQSAAEVKPQAVAGLLSKDTCLVKIAENYTIFDQYDKAKTASLFAYWFDKTKMIWVNPTFNELLGQTAAAADLVKQQATTQPAAWCNAAVAAEESIKIKVKLAKDGKKE